MQAELTLHAGRSSPGPYNPAGAFGHPAPFGLTLAAPTLTCKTSLSASVLTTAPGARLCCVFKRVLQAQVGLSHPSIAAAEA